jgi:hypothetical protein
MAGSALWNWSGTRFAGPLPVRTVVLNRSGVIVADAASSRTSLAEWRPALPGAI